VIDTGSQRVLMEREVGEFPEGIIVGPGGKAIYVANWFSNEMVVLDPDKLEIIGQIPTGESPRAFGVFIAGGT